MPLFLNETRDGKYPISPECAQWFLNLVADMFPHSKGLLTLAEIEQVQAATMDSNCWSDEEREAWCIPELTEKAFRCFGFLSSWSVTGRDRIGTLH